MKANLVIRLAAVVFIAVALFILPRLWGWSGLPLAVIGVVMVLTVVLVGWHARHTGYQCASCHHTFTISPVTDFLSPHLSGVKMLRCPQCGLSGWTQEIERAAVTDPPVTDLPQTITPSQGGTSLRLQITAVLVLYGLLWMYTLFARPSTSEFSLWEDLKIPLVTVILPILQVIFCVFALRRGYRSRIYFFVSLFVIVFILLAVWMQRAILIRP
jgi:DNA-directed RNA polymerase subunit RPC12/RpoP